MSAVMCGNRINVGVPDDGTTVEPGILHISLRFAPEITHYNLI